MICLFILFISLSTVVGVLLGFLFLVSGVSGVSGVLVFSFCLFACLVMSDFLKGRLLIGRGSRIFSMSTSNPFVSSLFSMTFSISDLWDSFSRRVLSVRSIFSILLRAFCVIFEILILSLLILFLAF